MATLDAPLDPVTVARLKGTLDYYLWRGIPVVRSWPRKPTMPRSPAVTASYTEFGEVAKALSAIPLEYQVEGQTLTDGSYWTWRDIWTAALYGNLYELEGEASGEETDIVPPLIPGNYYGQPSTRNGLTTASFASGIITAVPFLNPAENDFDRLTVEITATTTGTFRLAIYGPIIDLPTTAPLIFDSGTITPPGTGLQTFTIGLTLNPGWHLLAYQSSATRTLRAVAAAEAIGLFGQNVGANTPPASFLQLTRAYGPYPATLGAGAVLVGNAASPSLQIRCM